MNLAYKIDLQLFKDTTVPVSLIQKAWAKDLWTAAMKELYFNKFMGEGPEFIIHKLTNLKKEAGDRIIIPLLLKLTGEGVYDDADVEGNEEELRFHDFMVEVHEIAHAVRLKGKFEEQKTQIDLRKAAKTGLQTWLQEKLDAMIFAALTKDPTIDRLLLAGGKTAEGAVVAGDVFSAAMIGKAKRLAQLSNPKIRPVMVNGKKHWVMIIHPYQSRDLKNDPVWISAQENAGVRGSENPIFSGALGIYDDIVIHEHENIAITKTGANGTPVGHSLLLGAQAAAMAVAQEANWEEKKFNYNKRVGFEVDTILGVEKAVFNETDFATVQLLTSAIAD